MKKHVFAVLLMVGPGPLPLHDEMLRVARKHDVPVIDLHTLLRENHDIGILWWDKVHLTTFGQDFVGYLLADRIAGIMGSRIKECRFVEWKPTVTANR